MTEKKIFKSAEDLKKISDVWKCQGYEIVFTNGCFDIIHLGHIDYLEKAKLLGDKLIVGLNSDDSIRKIKGHNRPINNQYARSRMLAALAFVDAVVVFEEETPFTLIEYLVPDILVKGNDYAPNNIIGAEIVIENGGRVETIELVEGYSTSLIIKKVLNLNFN